ncbi:MAG: hypothetical protein R3C01_02070 [Planctomycetaceae bacterium]
MIHEALSSLGMREVTTSNFGLLIAYLLPGLVSLWGLSHVSTTLDRWLGADLDGPTVGGFLYVTLASIGAGLTVSTMRWLIIDTLHHRTGIQQPDWDFTKLGERTAAFDVLIEIHYRYYQFYGNTLIALWFAYVTRWSAHQTSWGELVAILALSTLFWFASRDTITKYYRRVAGVLTDRASMPASPLGSDEMSDSEADSPTS